MEDTEQGKDADKEEVSAVKTHIHTQTYIYTQTHGRKAHTV